MKFVQWTLAAVGALALALVLGGFFIPATFVVTRSIVIKAPPKKIYDLVVEPRQWARWSAWNRRDPNMKITYKGPPFGMGARWEWDSRSEGAGNIEFTRVEPDRAVEYTLFFAGYNMKSSGELRLEPQGDSTRVTWTSSGDVGGNPLKHYLAMTMDRMVGPDFEAGLAHLKEVAESP